jgi:hypothetical protein
MKTDHLAAVLAAALAMAAPAYAASTDIEGEWDVQTPSGGGLAELDIAFDGRSFQVRAAAVCSPKPCELGETSGTALLPPGRRNTARDVTAITASFNASDANRQIIATVINGNRLQVQTIQVYRDGRPGTITTETFRRADRSPGVVADCTTVSAKLRIAYQGGEWVLAQSDGVLATFDSPEEAGFARFLIAIQGLKQKCEVPEAGFEYWTLANGSFPSGAQAGEYCQTVNYRQISVAKSGRSWAVMNGRSAL